MKRFCLFLLGFCLLPAWTMADVIGITGSDVFISNISNNSSFSSINVSNLNTSHARNPITVRGLAEFSLQPLFDLGVDASDITSVNFLADFNSTASFPESNVQANIRFFKMTTNEDGTASTSGFNDGGVVQIGSSLTAGTYTSGLNIDVTNAFFEDFNNPGSTHTGFSIRLENELIGNTALFRFVGFEAVTLEVTFNSAIPEPSSFLLLSLVSVISLAYIKLSPR